MHLGFRLATASLISIATVTTYAQQKAARPISDRDSACWNVASVGYRFAYTRRQSAASEADRPHGLHARWLRGRAAHVSESGCLTEQ